MQMFVFIAFYSHICEINSHPVISWKHCASLAGYPVGSCFLVRSSQLRGKRTVVDVQPTRGSKLMGAMDPMVIPCCTVVVRIKKKLRLWFLPMIIPFKNTIRFPFSEVFPIETFKHKPNCAHKEASSRSPSCHIPRKSH